VDQKSNLVSVPEDCCLSLPEDFVLVSLPEERRCLLVDQKNNVDSLPENS
jgi:hypothetical protein